MNYLYLSVISTSKRYFYKLRRIIDSEGKQAVSKPPAYYKASAADDALSLGVLREKALPGSVHPANKRQSYLPSVGVAAKHEVGLGIFVNKLRTVGEKYGIIAVYKGGNNVRNASSKGRVVNADNADTRAVFFLSRSFLPAKRSLPYPKAPF